MLADDEEAALAAERERQRLAATPGTPEHRAAQADRARWQADAAARPDLDLTEAEDDDDDDDDGDAEAE